MQNAICGEPPPFVSIFASPPLLSWLQGYMTDRYKKDCFALLFWSQQAHTAFPQPDSQLISVNQGYTLHSYTLYIHIILVHTVPLQSCTPNLYLQHQIQHSKTPTYIHMPSHTRNPNIRQATTRIASKSITRSRVLEQENQTINANNHVQLEGKRNSPRIPLRANNPKGHADSDAEPF